MAKKFGYECPSFKGEELKFGDRAVQSNISKSLSKRFWQGDNVIYEVEFETIKGHMRSSLDEFFRKRRGEAVDIKEIEELWKSLRKQIIDYYGTFIEDKTLTPNKEKYIEKNLKKSYSLGPAFNAMFWLAVALEIFVIIAQSVAVSLAEGGYVDVPVIVIALFMGILLAIGGWLVGTFLATWWFERELDSNNISEEHLKPAHWFMLAIGMVLILFVGLARMFAGGGTYAFVISVILGALVSILKGFKDYFEGMRCFMGSLRLSFFRKQATRLHEDRIGGYHQTFLDTVREIANRYNIVLKEGTS